MIILDSSAALRSVLPQDNTDDRDAYRSIISSHHCASPALFLTEVGNAIWKEIRFRDLDAAHGLSILNAMGKMTTLHKEDTELVSSALSIAIAAEHPVYDCLFIALSRTMNAPILTADTKLRRKFPDDQFVDISLN